MRNPITCFLALILLLSPIVATAQVDLSGTLLGADGRPMAMANLVIQDGPGDTTVVVPVDASGQFAFTLGEPGGYGMYATGVHHETQEMPLILTKPEQVKLHIRLATNRSFLAPDPLYVVVASSEEAVEMQRRPDGRLGARVQAYADTLAYRIRHGGEASEFSSDKLTAGTSHDRLVFDESGPLWDYEGDYFSVLDVAEKPFVDIIYDASVLPRHVADPAVGSDPPLIANIAAVYIDVEQRVRRFSQAGNFIQHLWLARQERAPIKQRLERERDSLLRQWLILRYFDELGPLSNRRNRRLAREAFETIPPDSPLWSYEAWSSVGASNLMYALARVARDPGLANDYAKQVIDSHPDPDVRAQFLKYGVYTADREGDEKTKWLYYSMLQSSHAGTWQAERARRDFDPDRRLQAGNPIPQFSFISFDDSSVTITDSGLRGRMYLLDFWGTWCAPCIKEIPSLEEAYDRYQESGFEILSVAFLDDPADIESFRIDRYPMPWLHTRVGREDDASVREMFEITSFPRPILVDEDGIVIAIDDDLRDGKILDVVSAVFEGTE